MIASTEEAHQSARREQDKIVPLRVPGELKIAFSSLGRSLPGLWQGHTLRRAQKKALLRCLIEKIVAHRKGRDCVAVRIVWRGGAVTELDVLITVGSTRELSNFTQMEQQILNLEKRGESDERIAQLLTEQGFRSPLRETVLPSTVKGIRLHHRRFHRFRGPRPRRVAGSLTLPQVAERLGVVPHWLYHLIDRRVVEIDRDDATGLYLFPDSPDTIEKLRQLKAGAVEKVCYRRRHQDA